MTDIIKSLTEARDSHLATAQRLVGAATELKKRAADMEEEARDHAALARSSDWVLNLLTKKGVDGSGESVDTSPHEAEQPT